MTDAGSVSINEEEPPEDPVAALPLELALQIFLTLGSTSIAALCKASGVSKTWQALASDQQMWRKLYVKDNSDVQTVYAASWAGRPGTGDIADIESELPIHPLTDLAKVPHPAVEALSGRQLLRLLAARDRHFGLLTPRQRSEVSRTHSMLADLPRSSINELVSLALLPLPPVLPPCPPFVSLAKLVYFTARKDVSRNILASAHELSSFELAFRFKDPEDFMNPQPDRRILSQFGADGIYSSEWLVGERRKMRWRFLAPGSAYDASNYISSDSDDSSDSDFDPRRRPSYASPFQRRSRRTFLRSRIPPSLPPINMPNLSVDKPWTGNSRLAVEDYPVLTVTRMEFEVPKEREEEQGFRWVAGKKYLGWKLENDCWYQCPRFSSCFRQPV